MHTDSIGPNDGSPDRSTLTADQWRKCHALIHGASAAAAGVGAGLAQVPVSDSAVIVPIQITMIVGLGKIFKLEVTETAALGLTMGAVATFYGRALSQVLVGWIPGFGNALNAGTAAALTESVGWAATRKFALDVSKRSQVA